MDVVLGLDISTSVVGWAVMGAGSAIGTPPMLRGHIDLRKNAGGFWSKADQVERELTTVISVLKEQHAVVGLFIEDPVERFRNGLSSAHTIALLARFNALVSMHVRRLLVRDPLYIDATAARKAIGVPLLSKKKSGGIDQKQQTFSHLCETVFRGVEWPLNRNGKVQPWVLDEMDAYVICLAGCQGLGTPA